MPKVVSIDPPSGSAMVDASTVRSIVVVFDQAMHPSCRSVVHPPGFGPHDAGDLYWSDERTFVYPVVLGPDRQYELWFNYFGDHGFCNSAGEVANPFSWTLSTAPSAGDSMSAGAKRRMISRLHSAIERDYSHRDLYGIDWPEQFAVNDSRLMAARSPSEFAASVAALLSVAADHHLTVKRHGWMWSQRTLSTDSTEESDLRAEVADWWDNGSVALGHLPGGIGYVRIRSWDHGTRAALERIYEVVHDTAEGAGIIMDVRGNLGGDERWAQAVAGCFVRERMPYATVRVLRDGRWFGPYVNEVGPSERCGGFSPQHVAVLQDGASASTTESFVKMMRLAGAFLVGAPSAGSSGRPDTHRIGHGVVIGLPSWIETWPDGTPNEGTRIIPDILVGSDEYDSGVDGSLSAAMTWLAATPGSRSAGD